MSLKSRNTWFRRLGLAAVAAGTLGAATITAAPADAAVRAFVGPHGLHMAIVQHPHHDWWRHYDGYGRYGYGPGYYHRGW
jgi:hypothetical protein